MVSQTQHLRRKQRCIKHTTASLFFSNYGGKTRIQILFKTLAFPVHGKIRNKSIIILSQLEYALPDRWLQLHNTTDNLLVSKITTVLKQERPNASIDASNIPLVVYFTSDIDNRRAGL